MKSPREIHFVFPFRVLRTRQINFEKSARRNTCKVRAFGGKGRNMGSDPGFWKKWEILRG